jgi:4'-phosphopantetheinyl transferase
MNHYGKPRIAQPAELRELQFNLSHTDGFAACAVIRHRDVGIDVEYTERDLNVMDLARSVFVPTEVTNIMQGSLEGSRDRFF